MAPAVGYSSQFKAVATTTNGANVDVSSQAVWQSSNSAVLTVSNRGLVTGVAEGSAEVSATYSSVRGAMPVVVSTLACTFDVSPPQLALPASGASAQVNVTVTQGVNCSWTAESNSAFLSIVGSAGGTGNGSVSVGGAPNTGPGRSGSVTVAGQAVAVVQSPGDCVYDIVPMTQSVPAERRKMDVLVNTKSDCGWFAVSGSTFIGFVGYPTGVGPGTFSYVVGPNQTGAPRLGSVILENRQLAVMQDAPTGTYLTFTSDSGDYIGQGQPFVGQSPMSVFTFSIDAAQRVFRLNLEGHDGLEDFHFALNLAAPSGQMLLPGSYENATRYPFQAANVPGLDFGGNHRGCNQLKGRFVLLDAVYGPGPTVVRFHATFEQHCEGRVAALRGEVIIR